MITSYRHAVCCHIDLQIPVFGIDNNFGPVLIAFKVLSPFHERGKNHQKFFHKNLVVPLGLDQWFRQVRHRVQLTVFLTKLRQDGSSEKLNSKRKALYRSTIFIIGANMKAVFSESKALVAHLDPHKRGACFRWVVELLGGWRGLIDKFLVEVFKSNKLLDCFKISWFCPFGNWFHLDWVHLYPSVRS